MSTHQDHPPTTHPVPGDAAAVTSVAEQLHVLRGETVAAVEQRQVLAAQARTALIVALKDGLICRTGCEDALDTWGLEPLPRRWPVSAETELSYIREHTDQDEVREQAHWGVPDELRQLLPGMALYPRQVLDVTPVGADSSGSGLRPYRVTVRATLRTWVTATRDSHARENARTTVQRWLPALTEAGFTLTGLAWQVDDDPDDVPLADIDAEAPPETGTVRLPEADDDRTAATAARDTAVQALTELRRGIRARAIRALVDDEFSRDFQSMGEAVHQFLADLGLPGLPRAHHVTVAADLRMRVEAPTVVEARPVVRTAMVESFTTEPDGSRPWTAYGWPRDEDVSPVEGRWQVPWRHEYEMWLRGHTGSDNASAAADGLVRADLTRALAGVEHTIVAVTVRVEGTGIDPHLDPDHD